MAGEPIVTVVGQLGNDPELRFLPSGVAVANFSLASTPRTKSAQTEQWEDGTTLWLRCAVWREYGEHVAESLNKGDRVIVQGRLKQREYEKDGQKRVSFELDVDEVGPSLRYATARVTKAERGQGGQQPAQGGNWGQKQDTHAGPPHAGGYGQKPPQGAQQGGSPWAENPQGQLPAQGGGSAPGWGTPGQPAYQEAPF